MLREILVFLADRGQLPLASYLEQFAARYLGMLDPRVGLGFALFTLVVFAAVRRGEGGEPRPEPVPGSRHPALLPALAVAALSGAVALGVLGPLPHISDEATYLFEARLALGGAAAAPAPDPLVVELSRVPFSTVYQGKWLAAFPPGWPLVLAPGILLGIPWLVNALLGAANTWLLFLWLERRLGRDRAVAGCVLATLSPFWIAIHASTMADPLMLFCLLGADLAWAGGRPGVAALAASWAVLTRPAALFFVGPAFLVSALGARREGTRVPWVRLVVGTLPAIAVFLAWNHSATGSPWTTPYSLAAPAPAFLGGSTDYLGIGIRHDAVAAAVNLAMNLGALSVVVCGWPWVWLGIGVAGIRPARGLTAPGAWAAGLAGQLVGYALYFHPGFAYGPRFYLPWVPPLLGLTVLGIERLGALPGRGFLRVVFLLLPVSLVVVWVPELVELSRYAGMDARPLEHVDRYLPPDGRVLVLVPDVPYPDRGLFHAFLGRVDPWMADRAIYLVDPEGPRQPPRPGARERLAGLTGRRIWMPPREGAPWDTGFGGGAPGAAAPPGSPP